jgi:hypothetical protein
MLCVSKGEIFVLQEGTVLVYSIKNTRLLRQFGKSGEGPGELRVIPHRSNMMLIRDNSVFIDGYDKVIEYSRNGGLIRETRKTYSHFIVQPLGNRFVTLKRSQDEKNRIFLAVTLCDKDFKVKKELYRRLMTRQRNVVELFPDAQNFWTWEDKIFVEKSGEGFVLETFNSSGEPLFRISKEMKKSPVKASERKKVINRFKNDPEIKAMGGWNRVSKQIDFRFPDTFPPIREFTAGEGKLYVQTYHNKGMDVEYIILDLSGKILSRVFLPQGPPVLFDEELSGRINRFYSFSGEYYYYLMENEETETWEIHRLNWKDK